MSKHTQPSGGVPDEGTDHVDEPDRAGREDPGVDDLPDGAGCTEIWEHLSERRNGAE